LPLGEGLFYCLKLRNTAEVFGQIFGQNMSATGKQSGVSSPQTIENTAFLFTTEHTQVGSNPTVSTSAKTSAVRVSRLFVYFFGQTLGKSV
jgi:hypothetical protein